jgi:hypothetical protein
LVEGGAVEVRAANLAPISMAVDIRGWVPGLVWVALGLRSTLGPPPKSFLQGLKCPPALHPGAAFGLTPPLMPPFGGPRLEVWDLR